MTDSVDAETRAREIADLSSENETVTALLREEIAKALKEVQAASYNEAISDAAEKLESLGEACKSGVDRVAHQQAAREILALKKEPE